MRNEGKVMTQKSVRFTQLLDTPESVDCDRFSVARLQIGVDVIFRVSAFKGNSPEPFLTFEVYPKLVMTGNSAVPELDVRKNFEEEEGYDIPF